MTMAIHVNILALFFVAVVGVEGIPLRDPEPPTWPASYMAKGIINLPYAEIGEPFEAWYDGPNQRSRIDYYNGMDKTYQLAAQEKSYLISPWATEEISVEETCFEIDGPVQAQPVLPRNLTAFEYIGEENFEGTPCYNFRLKAVSGKKVNIYTLTVDQKSKYPKRYEMLGYDTLFGSHYDKYEVLYNSFDIGIPTEETFEIPKGMKCHGFPGPGAESAVIANPMRDYFSPKDEDRIHHVFKDFVKQYSKDYKDKPEFERRKGHFRQNLRFIHAKNRQNLGYRLKINHLADLHDDEFKELRGRQRTRGYNGGKPFNPSVMVDDIPDFVDWRLRGAVTPVKDQAICGSCWSFGATGAMEGALFLHTGNRIRLSQQVLMDCSWGFGNNACNGGEEYRAYQWVMKHGGIPSEFTYGPYLGMNGYCHFNSSEVSTHIDGYVNVTSGSEEMLKVAIATHGPCSVGIDASHKSFSFYSDGVYYEPDCGNQTDDLDHAVLAVGYGTMRGQTYWLVKNSWSTHWGNDGYILMSTKNNNCGVTTDATFVEIA
ncbi:digestive cysteine proteinase 1-like [Dendronephthya gigantea]|uniref:digestive cysteine proteinase 1-like n=1 Tax=Dendronephthya gigantea TaxID=151771 RepID=UPI00106912B4|nr:digestive cysteine proteinase 1-like [Dendronephthya gigantea]